MANNKEGIPPAPETVPAYLIPGEPAAAGDSRAHYAVWRKLDSGMETAGFTYEGLFETEAEAEVARLEHANAKPWVIKATTMHEKRMFTQAQADALNQEWLETTEVIFLEEKQRYHEWGFGFRVHGQDDGAHGSKSLNFREKQEKFR